MTPNEITSSIMDTRREMATATALDGGAIYRRLPAHTQKAWDAIGLPLEWLRVQPKQLRRALEIRAGAAGRAE